MEMNVQTALIFASLALVPLAFMLLTSFVKISVVLTFLRTAIGTKNIPSNILIAGFAALLSILVMAPVGSQAWDAFRPAAAKIVAEGDELPKDLTLIENDLNAGLEPFKQFWQKNAEPEEKAFMLKLARDFYPKEKRDQVRDDAVTVLMPAFVITELKEAFAIGFLLFIPFLVIDFLVASTLLSLGMTNMQSHLISMPFKLLLFIMIDGWTLIVEGLLKGYI